MPLLERFLQIIQDNQFLLAGLGLSGAGIITFWLKDVPKSIIGFIKRQSTTELTITSQHKIFYEILKWVQERYKNRNFRRLKLTNGRWGEDEASVTSIGYGRHFIWYRRHILSINLNKEDANQTERDKESLTIIKIGRNKKLFTDLIKEVEDANTKNNKLKLYIFNANRYWEYMRDQQRRLMSSVFIEKAKKDLLISSLERFISSENWYTNNGIPYQFGILLHGAPGTGKTSLIKAISSYLDYSVYYLPPSRLYYIETAMSSLPDKSILVIEDIDSSCTTHSRDIKRLYEPIIPPPKTVMVADKTAMVGSEANRITNTSDNNNESQIPEIFSLEDLSTILNSLDGMFSVHGRILIATTNHIEKLDKALIRPGRIDLKIEIGFVNNEILGYFMNNFYPDNIINFDQLHIKPDITVAMLQNMVLQNYTAAQLIDTITDSTLNV